jgi:hypothetical protein
MKERAMGLADLANVATVLSSIVVIVGGVIAVIQLKEMAKVRSLDGTLRIYEIIGSEGARRDRGHIYNQLNLHPNEITPEDRIIIERTLVFLDRVSTLINEGLVPRKVIFRSHGEIFVRTWRACAPYVHHLRQSSSPNFVLNLEKIALDTTKYLKVNSPNASLDPIRLPQQ